MKLSSSNAPNPSAVRLTVRERSVGSFGIERVCWILSAWRRKVHQWPVSIPRSHPPDFRQKVVELARSGRRLDDLAVEFQLARQTVRNWVKQADLDAGRRSDGLTTEERKELSRLRRENNKRLTVENEILSKAAAWFARESDVITKRSSQLWRLLGVSASGYYTWLTAPALGA